MKLACDKKHICLEDVESELINLRNLLCLLYDHFKYDDDYMNKETVAEITCQYNYYGSLNSACINAVDNIQALLNIVQENQKAVTV